WVDRSAGGAQAQPRRWATPLQDPPPLYFWALGVGFVVYVLFGAMVFSAMKLPRELRLRREVDGAKAAFLAAHRCMGSGELERLLSSLVSAAKDGVSPSGNATRHQNWDLASSLFFLVTMLITTSYLIIGLITLLVVIETFYGLQELQLFIQLFMRQEAQDSQPGAAEGNKAVAVTKSSISGAS
ncbi:potassium channel subfamily K member 1-like, partial [Narcine bancroftii]|uniref:potassium channel subfamily K member 1-like n=1 Tax=Narcine bancroftii TaxID=1343680 RepID=UPI00383149EB